ncbi:MAG: virulence RhuM family protein [Clostridia bacterium]|nr:virulence RhuM family protein [Clostridia bacterium]
MLKSKKNLTQKDFLIYSDENGNVKVNVILINNDIWLTQELIAKLFGKARNTITGHIKNIFKEGELDEKSNVDKIDIAESDKPVKIYNLNVIIAVGYRVNSKKATQFRIWATQVLNEYIKKGFVLDDERLKNGESFFEQDYFRELLERIRSIRTSERRIWQQITDIFAECSIDYDKNSEITKEFYAMVQNKFHYAITGKTAAEIIYTEADSRKENMGLTTWKYSPEGRILKSDVMIAKNYLDERQIKRLERTVSGYFDYIEDLVERENTFTMEEFSKSINAFLEFRKYDILQGKGNISRKEAEEKAEKEYNIFNKKQKITSDFDKLLIEAKDLKKKT